MNISSISDNSSASPIKTAGFARRSISFIIDAFILGLLILPGMLVLVTAVFMSDPGTPEAIRAANTTATVSYWLIAVLPLSYCIITTWIGRSPGNKLVGIRFFTKDGKRPGILRAVFKLLLQLAGNGLLILIYSWYVFNDPQGSLGNAFFITALLISILLVCVIYLWQIWDPEKRNLYDRATGLYAIRG